MKTLTFLRFYFRKAPRAFTLSIILVVLNCVLEAVTVLALVPVMDWSVHPDLDNASRITRQVASLFTHLGIPVSLMSFLGFFWALAALASGIAILAGYWQVHAKYRINADLFIEAPRDFFAARWQFFSSHSRGKLLNTLSHELQTVGDAFFTVISLVGNAFVIVINLIIPFYLSWQVTLISVLAAGAMLVPFLLLNRTSYRLANIKIASSHRLMATTQELLSLAKLVIGFGNQKATLRRLADRYEDFRQACLRANVLAGAIPHAYKAVSFLVLGLTLYAAAQLHVNLSEAAIILVSLYQTLPRLGAIATHRHTLEDYYASYEQVMDLRHQAQAMGADGGQRPFPSFSTALTFRGVSFAYPGCPPVLCDVDLTIPKGAMIAIVGPSGVGKSTLIDLIMGFHQPSQGEIRVDDVALHDLDLCSYRQRIGYVPQDSALFDLSIRDNLLWAKEDATEAELRRACELAYAAEFINELPQGYDTVVGDRGTRLSGGQVQRLALARAILRRPELLILDEATSALDSASERLIQQAIEQIAKDTTVVVIAHRLSTVRTADRIVVLQDGRVVQQDNYEALVNDDGLFSRMVQAQLLHNGAGSALTCPSGA